MKRSFTGPTSCWAPPTGRGRGGGGHPALAAASLCPAPPSPVMPVSPPHIDALMAPSRTVAALLSVLPPLAGMDADVVGKGRLGVCATTPLTGTVAGWADAVCGASAASAVVGGGARTARVPVNATRRATAAAATAAAVDAAAADDGARGVAVTSMCCRFPRWREEGWALEGPFIALRRSASGGRAFDCRQPPGCHPDCTTCGGCGRSPSAPAACHQMLQLKLVPRGRAGSAGCRGRRV